MPKYRKKPVVVEAFRNVPGATVPDWFQCYIGRELGAWITVSTPEGPMWAAPGDWIIKGVKGEFFPCKHDLFEATYEQVDYGQYGEEIIRPVDGDL